MRSFRTTSVIEYMLYKHKQTNKKCTYIKSHLKEIHLIL